MSAETSLQALLLADAGVIALVGNRVAADRIAEGSTRPFVIYSRTGSDPVTDIGGTVYRTLVTLDVTCWADTRLQADAVADAVTAAVRGVLTQTVPGRESVHHPDFDLEGCTLTVAWWE